MKQLWVVSPKSSIFHFPLEMQSCVLLDLPWICHCTYQVKVCRFAVIKINKPTSKPNSIHFHYTKLIKIQTMKKDVFVYVAF